MGGIDLNWFGGVTASALVRYPLTQMTEISRELAA